MWALTAINPTDEPEEPTANWGDAEIQATECLRELSDAYQQTRTNNLTGLKHKHKQSIELMNVQKTNRSPLSYKWEFSPWNIAPLAEISPNLQHIPNKTSYKARTMSRNKSSSGTMNAKQQCVQLKENQRKELAKQIGIENRQETILDNAVQELGKSKLGKFSAYEEGKVVSEEKDSKVIMRFKKSKKGCRKSSLEKVYAYIRNKMVPKPSHTQPTKLQDKQGDDFAEARPVKKQEGHLLAYNCSLPKNSHSAITRYAEFTHKNQHTVCISAYSHNKTESNAAQIEHQTQPGRRQKCLMEMISVNKSDKQSHHRARQSKLQQNKQNLHNTSLFAQENSQKGIALKRDQCSNCHENQGQTIPHMGHLFSECQQQEGVSSCQKIKRNILDNIYKETSWQNNPVIVFQQKKNLHSHYAPAGKYLKSRIRAFREYKPKRKLPKNYTFGNRTTTVYRNQKTDHDRSLNEPQKQISKLEGYLNCSEAIRNRLASDHHHSSKFLESQESMKPRKCAKRINSIKNIRGSVKTEASRSQVTELAEEPPKSSFQFGRIRTTYRHRSMKNYHI